MSQSRSQEYRLYGEVVSSSTPISGVECSIYDGTLRVGLATSSTDAANLGTINTLVEVPPGTPVPLKVQCTHSSYTQVGEEFTNLFDNIIHVTTVEMTGSSTPSGGGGKAP